uniref:Mitochondrial S-adenosylmethionine carrier protein n=1 Tax=Oryctolagus cuniculus TaxID=9986 RepID=A0A5F9CHC0_RABIT
MDPPGFTASLVVACLIRVPSEVVKQRAQVSASTRTFKIFSNILREEGIQGLYRGYKSTVLREALVLEAGSCGGFLAVNSLWSFCRWMCSRSHQPPGRGKDKNYVGKGRLQHCQGECAVCLARGLAVPGLGRVICRCPASHDSHQSGRLHLPGGLRSDPQPAGGSWQAKSLKQSQPHATPVMRSPRLEPLLVSSRWLGHLSTPPSAQGPCAGCRCSDSYLRGGALNGFLRNPNK